MKPNHYAVGMLVDHPNRPQWGPGKIVHVDGSRVHVIFRDAIERKARLILCAIVPLTVAASQTDEVLDKLPAVTEEGQSWFLPARFGPPSDPATKPKKKNGRAQAAPAVRAVPA